MEKQTKKKLCGEIFRFLLVGVVATVVDYFLFWLFDGVLFPLFGVATWWKNLSLIFSTALGFCGGLTVNWFLSISFVFRQVENAEKVKSKKAFAVFAAIGVIGLLLTEVGVLLLVALLPEISLFGTLEAAGTAWKKWFAKVMMTCLVLAWNYIGRKIFIFRG